MKYLILGSFIATLGLLPVYAFDTMVMPRLESMKSFYSGLDQTSQDIVVGKPVYSTNSLSSVQDSKTELTRSSLH